MKRILVSISAVFLLCATQLYAQLDSIQQLDEVVLSDVRLKDYSDGYSIQTISDTIVQRNSKSLTDVLRYNTTIYFKENGYGMVSSPSFRGTNAQQTAVIWNGIAINSNLNGQTDFNTISPTAFSSISIRKGGGSTQYGSGAVGGSIHLTNDIRFENIHSNSLRLTAGSFSTFEGNFKTQHADKDYYFDLGVDFISSVNDYSYKDLDTKNENGEFSKFNTALNAGLPLKRGSLTWNSNYFIGDRNLSGSITAIARDRYKDINTRNLITLTTKYYKVQSILKGAHLYEEYQYYPDQEKSLFFEGSSHTYLGEYQLDYNISPSFKITPLINYTFIQGKGDNIKEEDRNTLAAVLLIKHQVSNKWTYGFNFRQEFLNDFDNPFLFAFDTQYQIQPWYQLKVNASKNYRVPTFNDLYWNAGGNENLEAETSYQAGLGNTINIQNVEFDLEGFYISSTDLIKWQPNEENIWMPVNISETENYGVEFGARYHTTINKHSLDIFTQYAFTKAIDKEKNKQLIYVPKHKLTGLLQYTFLY